MISVRVRYLPPNLGKYITELPRRLRGKAAEFAADWIIGDGRRGLKHYPPYKHIRRRTAYGQPFKTDKQRRYVMMQIRKGIIDPGVPHRTGTIQRAWRKRGSGAKVSIVNDARGVEFVHDDNKQARLNKLVGWRTVSAIVQSNERGAIRHIEAELKKLLP